MAEHLNNHSQENAPDSPWSQLENGLGRQDGLSDVEQAQNHERQRDDGAFSQDDLLWYEENTESGLQAAVQNLNPRVDEILNAAFDANRLDIVAKNFAFLTERLERQLPDAKEDSPTGEMAQSAEQRLLDEVCEVYAEKEQAGDFTTDTRYVYYDDGWVEEEKGQFHTEKYHTALRGVAALAKQQNLKITPALAKLYLEELNVYNDNDAAGLLGGDDYGLLTKSGISDDEIAQKFSKSQNFEMMRNLDNLLRTPLAEKLNLREAAAECVKDFGHITRIDEYELIKIIDGDTLQKYGADISPITEKLEDDFLTRGRTGLFELSPEKLRTYNVDLKQLVERAMGMGGDGLSLKQREKLKTLGYEWYNEDIDALDEQISQEVVACSEYSDEYFDYASLNEEARKEESALLERLNIEDEKFDIGTALEIFKTRSWAYKNRKEMLTDIQNLGDMLAKTYNLRVPYSIDFESMREDYRGGYAAQEWSLARADNNSNICAALESVGISVKWIPFIKIKINENRARRRGSDCVDTIAHELWHAFQYQQAFLYAQGYFEHGQRGGDFLETPELARLYFANLKGENCYQESADNYERYRNQLVEAEAFRVGSRYAGMVAAEKKDATDK